LRGANPQLSVIWHGHCGCRISGAPLHHDMAALSADLYKSVLGEYSAHLSAREDPEVTQR